MTTTVRNAHAIATKAMSKSVIIGMSGGVDSSASAALLKRQGYEVVGVTMKLWNGEQADAGCCSFSAIDDAKRLQIHLESGIMCLIIKNSFSRM